MTEKSENRGGRREGAGAPEKDITKLNKSFTIRPETMEIIDTIKEERELRSHSEALDLIVRFFDSFRQLIPQSAQAIDPPSKSSS